MSKSAGNIILIDDLLKDYTGESVRLAMISTHYKQPLEWSDKILKQANKNLENLYEIIGDEKNFNNVPPEKKFMDALFNDLNTPEALKEIYQIAKNKDQKNELKASANFLGILQYTQSEWMEQRKKIKNINQKKIEEMIKKRDKARKERDFVKSDKIRNELALQNIILEDTPKGTFWRIRN